MPTADETSRPAATSDGSPAGGAPEAAPPAEDPPVQPRPLEAEEQGGDPACWADLVEDHRDHPAT